MFFFNELITSLFYAYLIKRAEHKKWFLVNPHEIQLKFKLNFMLLFFMFDRILIDSEFNFLSTLQYIVGGTINVLKVSTFFLIEQIELIWVSSDTFSNFDPLQSSSKTLHVWWLKSIWKGVYGLLKVKTFF